MQCKYSTSRLYNFNLRVMTKFVQLAHLEHIIHLANKRLSYTHFVSNFLSNIPTDIIYKIIAVISDTVGGITLEKCDNFIFVLM